MIPKVSAALSRILRPIRFKAKTGTGSAKLEADVSEHESAREDPRQMAPITVTAVESAPADTPTPLPIAHVSAKKKDGETAAPVKVDDLGLTAVILEMRNQAVTGDNGEVATQYENSSREQKTGSKLPKGSMVDRKAG